MFLLQSIRSGNYNCNQLVSLSHVTATISQLQLEFSELKSVVEDLKSSSTQLLPASQDENPDIGVTDSEATQSGMTETHNQGLRGQVWGRKRGGRKRW